MPLTRDSKETIRDRVQRDARFRKELLREGLEAMLSGEITLAKTILRDYINATPRLGSRASPRQRTFRRKASCACSAQSATRVRPICSKL